MSTAGALPNGRIAQHPVAAMPSVTELRRRISVLATEGSGPWSSGAAQEIDDLEDALEGALASRLNQFADSSRRVGDAVREARELNRLAAELVKEVAIGRLRAVERVQAAVDRLAEAGPVSEIVDRAPSEACVAADLDRVVVSQVDDGWLRAEAVHVRDDLAGGTEVLARLKAAPVRLAYPLVEAEVTRRRRAQILTGLDGSALQRYAYAEIMESSEYVATPIVLEGRVIGFFHGDRKPSGRPLQALDRDTLWHFAESFADIFERAVLRRRLRTQRQEVRQIGNWAEARTSELSDGAIDLAVDREAAAVEQTMHSQSADSALRDLLTRRELDVLEEMVKGGTNADIARALVVAEGTVKFHVKNILRKLRVSNRAAAISQSMRLSQQPEARAGDPASRSR